MTDASIIKLRRLSCIAARRAIFRFRREVFETVGPRAHILRKLGVRFILGFLRHISPNKFPKTESQKRARD
jgi:hypothetical protein